MSVSEIHVVAQDDSGNELKLWISGFHQWYGVHMKFYSDWSFFICGYITDNHYNIISVSL